MACIYLYLLYLTVKLTNFKTNSSFKDDNGKLIKRSSKLHIFMTISLFPPKRVGTVALSHVFAGLFLRCDVIEAGWIVIPASAFGLW